MPNFWLDANIFIDARNGPYAFDIAPAFWLALDAQLRAGTVGVPAMVYRELVGKPDDISTWIRQRKGAGGCVAPDQDVQENFRQVANYVGATYQYPQAADFLKGADGWVIAHAIGNGSRVVTHESELRPNANKARIPDVSNHFGVGCCRVTDMLRSLLIRF